MSPRKSSFTYLEGVAKAAAVFLGLVIVAQVIGWVYAVAYFGRFGAEWIVFQLSSLQFAILSKEPIAAILFVWLVSKFPPIRAMMRHRRWRAIPIVGFPVLFSILVVASRSMTQIPAEALVISYSLTIGLFVVAGIELYREDLAKGLSEIKGQAWLLLLNAVFFGLFIIPTILGVTIGDLARNPASSELPVVVAMSIAGEDQELRLLFSSNDTLYVVGLRKDAQSNEVMMLGQQGVKIIGVSGN